MSTDSGNDKPKVLDAFISQNPELAGAKVGGGGAASNANAAGMGIRILARLIDGLLISVFNLLFWLFVPFSGAVGLIFQFLYGGYFYQEHGATPGKMAMGIKVVDFESGQRLTFLRGGLRDSLGTFLSGIILGIGYLIAFFTEGHRALHDYIFNTRVDKA